MRTSVSGRRIAGMSGEKKAAVFLKRKRFLRPFSGLCLAVILLLAGLFGMLPAHAAEEARMEDAKWNLAMIGADSAFAQGYRGRGARVGVIDSGVNPHPAFSDRLVEGHNYIADAADPDDTTDEYGHGTRVAGLIAAAAPEAEIVPLKITNGGSINISQLCAAIYGGIDDYGCDVLNLSLGVPHERESLRRAVEYAARKGVVVVAATGNDGTGEIYYPAAYDSVIGVTAVDSDGALSARSNNNESVGIAAPGVKVETTGHRGGTVTESGCSYAVPHVSAAAAILIGIDGSLTSDEVTRLLYGTATDRGITGYDEYYGCGILNIAASVEALTAGKTDPGTPLSEPALSPAGCARDASCVMARFSDLDPSAWYHDGIHYALDNGIMNGADANAGLFAPDAPTSRAMIVTILWRREGEPAAVSDMTFADVPPGAWYAEAVRWAVSAHIVEGYGPARFGPDDPVSREQLAAILYRCGGCIGADRNAAGDSLSRYADAGEVSPWAVTAMRWAVDAGLIGGVSGGRLSPASCASRAQTATILMRCAGLFE